MDGTGELFPQHGCGPMGGSICQRGRLRFSLSEREWDSPSLMALFEVSTEESAIPRSVLAHRLPQSERRYDRDAGTSGDATRWERR